MFISLIIKGGPIMVPIIALSIIGLALILERIWTLWKIRLDIPQFAKEIFLYIERGHDAKKLNIPLPMYLSWEFSIEPLNGMK
jgi:biopolymer transport protein ExbB/TolQ